MLQNISTMNGCTIVASDGKVGTVSDLLFDDTSWTVRWMVIDTGSWLSGRRVLLPPSVMGHVDAENRSFNVRLTHSEIEASPAEDTHLPVSRQHETDLYEYYRWSPYWGTGSFMGAYGGLASPMLLTRRDPGTVAQDVQDARKSADEPHLRSANEVTGYHIHATDGEIGHLSDILVEDMDWTLRYLVVDTSNWWMGKKVLLSPRSVKTVDWAQRLVYLDASRAKIKSSPDYDPDHRPDRAMQDSLAAHYADREENSPQ